MPHSQHPHNELDEFIAAQNGSRDTQRFLSFTPRIFTTRKDARILFWVGIGWLVVCLLFLLTFVFLDHSAMLVIGAGLPGTLEILSITTSRRVTRRLKHYRKP